LTRHVTSADGTRIAVERQGSGPALIIIDGAGCSRLLGASLEWAPALADQFTVYTYDRRGRGESTDTAPYAVERELDDLRAVIGVAGEAPYLVGFSTGAVLARSAVEAGVPTSGIALFEPPLMALGDHEGPLSTLIEQGRPSAAVVYWMTRVVGMSPTSIRLMRLLARRSWPLLVAAAPSLRYDLAVLTRAGFAPRPDLSGREAVPTLVLGGEGSPARLRAATEQTAAVIPGSRLQWLPSQGQRVTPPVATAAITAFFAPG
jgi:pimeloyl-ACP methyl ester carboxylesterase